MTTLEAAGTSRLSVFSTVPPAGGDKEVKGVKGGSPRRFSRRDKQKRRRTLKPHTAYVRHKLSKECLQKKGDSVIMRVGAAKLLCRCCVHLHRDVGGCGPRVLPLFASAQYYNIVRQKYQGAFQIKTGPLPSWSGPVSVILAGARPSARNRRTAPPRSESRRTA